MCVQINDAPAVAEADLSDEIGCPAPIGVEIFSDALYAQPAGEVAQRSAEAARAVLRAGLDVPEGGQPMTNSIRTDEALRPEFLRRYGPWARVDGGLVPVMESQDVAAEALAHLAHGPTWVVGEGNRQIAAQIWPASQADLVRAMIAGTEAVCGPPAT